MGLEPTTFSLGSWNGFEDARASGVVGLRPRATSAVRRGQGTTGRADQKARTSADGSGPGFWRWRDRVAFYVAERRSAA
jgi:hypothetical protein